MLPPTPMLATKNRISYGIIGLVIFLLFTIYFADCGQPGPRALLKGKKLLDRGDYTEAVARLKTATSLLVTNAQAWNYLGVAEQHAGQPADAVQAYQRALMINRDLVEAHYNLGCLWLEQNRPDAAKVEFTAYTLRRSNAPEGWAKLGVAHLGLHDFALAEKSFSTALSFDPHNAEALNGLGLAWIQRGHPNEAAQYFTAAVQAHPDYEPALLNLATVAQRYLHDNPLALKNYRAYLALSPRRANWDEVNAIANDLEQQANAAANPPWANRQVSSAPPGASEPKTQLPSVVSKTQLASAKPPAQPGTVARANPKPPRESAPVEIVQVQPEPAIVGAQESSAPAATNPSASAKTQPEQPGGKPGIMHRINPLNWFHSTPQEPKVTILPPSNSNNPRVNPAPEPATSTPAASTPAVVAPAPAPPKPVQVVRPPPPSFPRYSYLSPSKPKPGNRQTATRAFAQAQQFEQEERFSNALDSYREAARLDPGWFEAQYNCGVMAYRLRNFGQSLAACEMALAIRPDSADARYNFALSLKAAGYVTDAMKELEKILASNPNDVRAHLTLGNIYARQLHDLTQARAHYLKVLQLDPRNPQATDIQFWLSANPP
jgi:tetratricopeptide (TPR) repeat protein